MLRVRIDVDYVAGRQLVDELRIVNRGSADEEAHRYEWHCDCHLHGVVEHVRSLGAHELLRLVLLDHANETRRGR